MNLLSQESMSVILFLLIITMIAYGLFPICFSLLRKKAITVGRYDLLCYIFNFFVHFMFYLDGSKSQSGPYMLWTCVFTIIGCKILKKRGVLRSRLEIKQSSDEIDEVRDNDICKEEQIYKNEENVASIKSCESHIMSIAHINNDKTKEKKIKVRFCKFCGGQIDAQTKKCSGCGKQYFKGIKFNKFFVTVLTLSLVIITSIILNIVQFVEMSELKDDKGYYQEKTIKQKTEISNLKKEKAKMNTELQFYERHAEIVGDDGTNVYHKYGCAKLDTSDGLWIYNSKAAAQRYKKCNLCH